jgi:hypothetical protein
MSGDAYDRSVTEEPTGGFCGEILLAEMNTIGFKSKRYIYPIVYYDPYAALTSDMQGLLRLFEKLARRQILFAELN